MPPAEWKVAGQSVPKIDGRAFVTGRHRYTSDLERPGMLRGKVLRPPSFGARLASLDTSRAEAMPGVKVVRDGDFVGVVAPTRHAATRALAALRPTWTPADGPATLRPGSRDSSRRIPSRGDQGFGNRSAGENGSVKDELAAAHVKVEAVYTVAYIAHAPLEPRAAVAEWEGDRLTVWTGTQRPFGARSELAQAFHLPEDRSPGARPRHGQRLRRQAHQRGRGRGRPAGHRPRASR